MQHGPSRTPVPTRLCEQSVLACAGAQPKTGENVYPLPRRSRCSALWLRIALRVRLRFAPLRMTRGSFGKTTIVERADRFILSLVDPDAPPDGSASLCEFGYGLRPTLWMTRGSFGKTTIGELLLLCVATFVGTGVLDGPK